MAQGRGKRWIAGKPKVLAPIGGEPIICRTIRQLHALKVPASIVVIAPANFAEYIPNAHIYEVPHPGDEVCYGIRDTADLWEGHERVIIMLGDVIWSWAALEEMVTQVSPLRFFGRLRPSVVTGKKIDERFALTFTPEATDTIMAGVRRVLADYKCTPGLKSLYQDIIGAPHSYPEIDLVHWEDEILCQIDDYTDDVDNWKEYITALGPTEQAIKEEERKRANDRKTDRA
jgi:hypothetical protein